MHIWGEGSEMMLAHDIVGKKKKPVHDNHTQTDRQTKLALRWLGWSWYDHTTLLFGSFLDVCAL